MIFPFVNKDFLVGDGVITFPVDHVLQRSDFRELFSHVGKQSFTTFLIFVEEDHDHHQITGRSRPDHQRTDEAFLIPQVEERITLVCQAVIFNRQADPVRNIVLQPAFVNIQYFIEHSRNMETDSVHAVERFAGLHLFFRQPFLVRKGKLQFVTIKLCMLGTQDRQDFFHLNLANTGQVVDNLFLFVF